MPPRSDRSWTVTHLAWDSECFGFPVARLDRSADPRDLLDLLREAAAAGVVLAYWFASPDTRPAADVLTQFDGRLVDRKVTYAIRIAELPRVISGPSLESYQAAVPDVDVRALALQSGVYSRFRVDPRLASWHFEAVYDAWITRSVRREIADEVLVARSHGKPVGLVTLAAKVGRGDIGLLAVDTSARGQGIGRSLVQAALEWSRARGMDMVQVVTQLDNGPACALYEACGFTIERVEHVYHFWMPSGASRSDPPRSPASLP